MELISAHLKELIVMAFVVMLALSFVVFFVVPTIRISRQLKEVTEKLLQTKQHTNPKDVSTLFGGSDQLHSIWKEYEKTLHQQQVIKDGEIKIGSVYSTVPADAYFSPETIFEGETNSEFFKHLPGILTGLGIIGTFLGLIVGLNEFASIQLGNPQETQVGLRGLMSAVEGAFKVSAFAIIAAMLITFFEKLQVKRLTSLVHEMVQAIDALYDAGAGEDYLARIVRASEESSAQTKILKDALVKELGDLLRELTEAQISAATRNTNLIQTKLHEQSHEIGVSVSKSINEGLKAPLDKVADLVAVASGEQGSTATKMLQEVMTSFGQKLNDLFGDQISGINKLNQEAASNIKQAVDGIQSLLSALQESGKKTADEMSQRMVDAIERMASRQDQINAQSKSFVEELKKIMADGQSQSQSKLLETMAAMQEHMQKIADGITGSQNEVFEKNRTREIEMSNRASSMVNGMSDTVKGALEEIAKATRLISESVDSLSRTTTSAIDRMNTSAELMSVAAEDFTKAGNSVGNVFTKSAALVESINTTSSSLATSANALQNALEDYKAQRSSLGSLLTEFKQAVELAKKDTQLTGEVLSRLEKATSQLGLAEKAAEEYLDGVTKVLAETHESFTREMSKSVAIANRDFHQNLKTAIDLLATTIADLEASLGSAISRKA